MKEYFDQKSQVGKIFFIGEKLSNNFHSYQYSIHEGLLFIGERGVELQKPGGKKVIFSGHNKTYLKKSTTSSNKLNLILEQELIEKNELIKSLEAEVLAIEQLFQNLGQKNSASLLQCNLRGRCILYIGGRPSVICKFCDIVRKMNGNLIHHDGGENQSLSLLQGAISVADAVMSPINSISYSSATEAEKLCKRMDKPFMPV